MVARHALGPLIDRVGSKRFGRYRGWLIDTPVALVVVLAAYAAWDPQRHLAAVSVAITVVLAMSALHDTAINWLAPSCCGRTSAGSPTASRPARPASPSSSAPVRRCWSMLPSVEHPLC